MALHVAQIGFSLDPLGRRPRELLEAWPSLVDVAEAAARAAAQVSVVQACPYAETFTAGRVAYHFVAPEPPGQGRSQSRRFAARIAAFGADVFHVHGLGFPAEVTALAELAPATPILLQDHADRPPRVWRRMAWRRGFRHAAGVAFCAREQAQPFVAARLLAPTTTVFEIPESTSRFTPAEQREARRLTNLTGDPCILWVGRLDANKDPLTLLEGVSRACRALPQLQVWCCFAAAPLLAEVSRRVHSDPELRTRVHLLGQVPHPGIETLMRAADLYVSASHREGSGYALIEALACGLTPVVTDIAPFRALTGRGAVGELWASGNAAALASALVAAAGRDRAVARAAVRAHYATQLSFDALGRQLVSAYAQLRERAQLLPVRKAV